MTAEIYTYTDLVDGLEAIFTMVASRTPRSVLCGRCGDVVTVGEKSDCTCGYIGKMVDYLIELEKRND